MVRIRWRDLDDEQRNTLRAKGHLNGCGPQKFGWCTDLLLGFLRAAMPTDFQLWCDQHDFNYLVGHTEADRIKADWQMYEAFLVVAKASSWWNRWRYIWYAWLGYQGVRRLGQSSFYYAEEERSWEDILCLQQS